MRRIGARPYKPILRRVYDTKSVGSAAANPGSEPKIPKLTPSAIQADSSNVVGVTEPGPGSMNEVTVGKQKYKYKYKYPSGSKRKRDESDEGLDVFHMQQKAMPGEQYRGGAAMRTPPYKRPAIEQYSKAGDQYETGASVATDEKKTPQSFADQGMTMANLVGTYHTVKWMGEQMLQYAPHIPVYGSTLKKALDSIPQPIRDAITAGFKATDALAAQQMTGASAIAIDNGIDQALKYVKSTDFAQSVGDNYKEAISEVTNFLKSFRNNVNENVGKGPSYTAPKGQGNQPGESYVPNANVQAERGGVTLADRDNEDEGVEPLQAYQDGTSKAPPGGDPNRTDPITPATGSRQTPASANSIVSIRQLKAAAEHTARTQGIEAVHGTAEERANMGKGALDTYEFQGPYDYPTYPGGRPDDTLSLMGAWRTDGGNDSSLWYSKKTAKGANAKRNKYFKWSAKKGGRWRKMSKDEMVNVFQKGGQNDNRFYGTRAGLKFTEFQRRTLGNRDRSNALARLGNELRVYSEHGDYGETNKFVQTPPLRVTPGDVPSNRKNGKTKQGPKEGTGDGTIGEQIKKREMAEVEEAKKQFAAEQELAKAAAEEKRIKDLPYAERVKLMNQERLLAETAAEKAAHEANMPKPPETKKQKTVGK
jgi:hypothetical protein